MGYAAAMHGSRRVVGMILGLLVGCAPQLDVAEVTELVRASQEAPDLAAVWQFVGAARIVGMGEPTPGALDVELLTMLMQGREVGGLALDVDATAARALDAYVLGGEVDVDAALHALGEPGLATVEFRGVLERVRGRNGGSEGRKLRVFGLDPRDGDAAAGVVLAFLERVDPAYVPTARSMFKSGEQLAVDQVLARLDEKREAYAAPDVAAYVDARQQAEVAAQARRMVETWEFEAREFARARNAEWALGQTEGGRLIVVASNRQIAAEVPGAAPSMGNFLRQWLAREYRPIAVSAAGGQVRGADCAVEAVGVEAGSVEAGLAAAGGAVVLVDLRGQQGALARPQRLHGETLRPSVAFDAIWAGGRARPATALGGGCPRG